LRKQRSVSPEDQSEGGKVGEREYTAADTPTGWLGQAKVEEHSWEKGKNERREASSEDEPEGDSLTARKALVRSASECRDQARETRESRGHLSDRS
jgi:hypothetical protein